MASPNITALRAELNSARSDLAPQLKGLQALTLLALSNDANLVVDAEISVFQNRLTLIDAVLAALDALENSGYPDTLVTHVSTSIIAELKAQADAILAALGEFTPDTPNPEATSASITAGTPELK